MLKKLLINLKWWLLPVTVIVCLMFLNAATDANGISSDEEGIMWGAWLLLLANAALFICNKRWNALVDRVL